MAGGFLTKKLQGCRKYSGKVIFIFVIFFVRDEGRLIFFCLKVKTLENALKIDFIKKTFVLLSFKRIII
jgi:hypothetical protein